MTEPTVLDASVIIAAVLGEPGGDAVFDMIDWAVVSAVNVAEVYGYAATNALPSDAFDAVFDDTGIEIVPFEHQQAIVAGGLVAVTRQAGPSLGDRSCIALARGKGLDRGPCLGAVGVGRWCGRHAPALTRAVPARPPAAGVA